MPTQTKIEVALDGCVTLLLTPLFAVAAAPFTGSLLYLVWTFAAVPVFAFPPLLWGQAWFLAAIGHTLFGYK